MVLRRTCPFDDRYFMLPADVPGSDPARVLRSRPSALRPSVLHFVIHTRCKWISNTVCAPAPIFNIPEVYPARTC